MNQDDKALQERLDWVAKIQGDPAIAENPNIDNRHEVTCPKCGYTEIIPPEPGEKGGLFGAKFSCKKCKKSFRFKR